MECMYTKVVFFDIGATLISGPTLTPARQVAVALGLDDIARYELNQHLLTSMVETPAALAMLLTVAYPVLDEVAASLAAAVWRSQTEAPEVVHGGIELLSSLRAAGVRYGFISNIWLPYAATFLRLYGSLAETGLTFFSFRLGLAKPNIDIFLRAAATAGVTPQSCVMVGDSYDSDMRPAIALGMKTVWILHRPEQELIELDGVWRKKLPAPNMAVSTLARVDIAMLAS